MLAKDGVNKTFDSTADGYVRGEGAVAIILSSSNCQYLQNKPLAYLLSSAVNQDGRSASLTAPSGLAQKKLLERSLSLASFASSDITYIETHGTGKNKRNSCYCI
jgi:polyketide synthase 12/myxalamid-type polyketide synthase MxaB